MPQTPPTDKRTTSLLSTTTDTTTDSSTLNSEQSKQTSTNKTAADSSADSTIPDIRMNTSRQVPPSLRLPKKGRLIGDSNLRHVDRRRLDQSGKIHVRTVGGATAGDFSASRTNQTLVMLLSTLAPARTPWQAAGHCQLPGARQATGEGLPFHLHSPSPPFSL